MSVKQAILDTRVGDLLLSIYRKFKGTSYARRRSHCKYYPAVVRFARQHAPGAETVLEVGPYDTDTLLQLDWIADRTAVDIIRKPRLPRTKNIRADFMTYHPEKKFDLVLCVQVLEHLNEPGPFAHKLLETGHVVIISVPYLWPEHACPAHVQDPVDEEKLLAWTGRPWAAHEIITEDNGDRRLIGVWRWVGKTFRSANLQVVNAFCSAGSIYPRPGSADRMLQDAQPY